MGDFEPVTPENISEVLSEVISECDPHSAVNLKLLTSLIISNGPTLRRKNDNKVELAKKIA